MLVNLQSQCKSSIFYIVFVKVFKPFIEMMQIKYRWKAMQIPQPFHIGHFLKCFITKDQFKMYQSMEFLTCLFLWYFYGELL
jgi:hypothetical protein